MENTLYNVLITEDIDKLSQLISSGINIDCYVDTGSEQQTPLHIACLNLNLDIIKLLLHHGADPNKTFIECFTHTRVNPLMYILSELTPVDNDIQHCASKCAELLLDAGLDILYKNEQGITAPSIASNNNSPLASMLEQRYNEAMAIYNIKQFVYQSVLKRGIPRQYLKNRFKAGSMGSKIVALHYKHTQHGVSNKLPYSIKNYLDINEDTQINRIDEFIRM